MVKMMLGKTGRENDDQTLLPHFVVRFGFRELATEAWSRCEPSLTVIPLVCLSRGPLTIAESPLPRPDRPRRRPCIAQATNIAVQTQDRLWTWQTIAYHADHSHMVNIGHDSRPPFCTLCTTRTMHSHRVHPSRTTPHRTQSDMDLAAAPSSQLPARESKDRAARPALRGNHAEHPAPVTGDCESIQALGPMNHVATKQLLPVFVRLGRASLKQLLINTTRWLGSGFT